MWDYFPNQRLCDQLVVQGFKAVSYAHCQTLINALVMLRSAKTPQLKRHWKILQELRAIKAQKPLNVQRLKSVIAQEHAIKRQLKFARYFNQPDFWKKRKDALLKLPDHKNTVGDYQKLKALEKSWKIHGRYAGYSTKDLLHVYQQILPVFTHWLTYARTELQVKRQILTKELADAYDSFLNQLADEVEIEKRQIRASFIARLEAGIAMKDIRFDQVLFIAQEQLITLGVWQSTDRLMLAELPGEMMPNSFTAIQYLLEQDSTEEERAAFYALPYRRHFNHQNAHAPYRYYAKGRAYYIPSQLIPAIPLELPFYLKLPKFLHFLFSEEKLRYEFFQQPTCQYLLAIEVAYPPIEQWLTTNDIDLENLSEQHQWQCLTLMLNYLALERERTQAAKRSLWSWFHAETLHLLDTYEQQLQQKAHRILAKQEALLNTFSSAIPFTETHKAELNSLLRPLKVHDRVWGNPISQALATLAEKEVLSIEVEALVDTTLPIVSPSKPELREKTIFDRFYADIDNVLRIYQQEKPFKDLPTHRQQDIQQLTAILQKNAIERDVVPLREGLATYRKSMQNEQGLPLPALFDGDLRKELDVVLNTADYNKTALNIAEQMEIKKELTQLENLHRPLSLKQEESEQLPLERKKQLKISLTDITKEILSKDQHVIEQDMKTLLAYQDHLEEFTYQVYGYSYYLLEALSQLPSKEAFKKHLPRIKEIANGLLQISQEQLFNLKKFLLPIYNAEIELERPLYKDDWPFFVEIHFISNTNSLKKYYFTVDEINQQTQKIDKPILRHDSLFSLQEDPAENTSEKHRTLSYLM